MPKDMDKIIDGLKIRDYVEKLPFYKGEKGVSFEKKGLPPIPNNIKTIDPSDSKLNGNYIMYSAPAKSNPVEIAHDVKRLFGVPEELGVANRRAFPDISRAGADNRPEDIQTQAYRYLLMPTSVSRGIGPAGAEDDVIKFIVENATDIPIFFANEMIINDGQTIFLKNTAVAIFNTLIIKGSGKLDISQNRETKLVTKILKNK